MMDSGYLHLGYRGTDACTGQHDGWGDEAARTWLCQACRSLRPWHRPIDAHIQEARPSGGGPIQFVMGYGLTLVSSSFLACLPAAAVERDLVVGAVVGRNGPVVDWACIQAKERVFVRGTKKAAVRRCDTCGRDLYYAVDRAYVSPAPPGNVDIFTSDLCGVVLSPRLARLAADIRGRQLRKDWLAVLDEAADGLGALRWQPSTRPRL